MADYEIQFHIGGPAFKLNDLIMARKADYDQKANKSVLYEIQARVIDVSREGQITAAIYKGAEHLDRFGRELVFTRFGNTTDASRQGSIFITADDLFNDNNFDDMGAAPYIDIRDGVDSYEAYSDVSTLKVRLGNLSGITNDAFGTYQPEGYGLYSENCYLTGTFVMAAGSTGFAMLADKPTSISDIDPVVGLQFQDTPTETGLFISAIRMGYYNQQVADEFSDPDKGWMTYMGSGGVFFLRGKTDDDAWLQWSPVDGSGHSSLELHNAPITALRKEYSNPSIPTQTEYRLEWYGHQTKYKVYVDGDSLPNSYNELTMVSGFGTVNWTFVKNEQGHTPYNLYGAISYDRSQALLGIMSLTITADELISSCDGVFGGNSVAAIANGLSAKAEATHGHVISDVTGLETALSGKLDVLGTALTGQLVLGGETLNFEGGLFVGID